eukprot:511724-Alexandrium_andersonii.AAC.1
MSASLVGSEMCIRDRGKGKPQKEQRNHLPGRCRPAVPPDAIAHLLRPAEDDGEEPMDQDQTEDDENTQDSDKIAGLREAIRLLEQS